MWQDLTAIPLQAASLSLETHAKNDEIFSILNSLEGIRI
jgi:hypothetical protein